MLQSLSAMFACVCERERERERVCVLLSVYVSFYFVYILTWFNFKTEGRIHAFFVECKDHRVKQTYKIMG